jgi:SAM-dependent methyltransferase
MTASIPAEEWPVSDLEEVPLCPVCGAGRRVLEHASVPDLLFGSPGRWSLYRCQGCRSMYLDPRPSRAAIGRAYATYYTHASLPPADGILEKLHTRLRYGYLNRRYGYSLEPAWRWAGALLAVMPRQRTRALREIRHLRRPSGPRRLLDIGSGNGAFLDFMRWQDWEVQGVEPDPTAVAASRKQGLAILEGSADRLADFAPASFDAITMSHVIEHLHDPLEVLRACRRVLAPGGVLSIATPNADALSHAWFGASWRGLEVPRHLVLFTRSGLINAVTRAGLSVSAAPRGGWEEMWIEEESRRIETRRLGVSDAGRSGRRLRARATNWAGWMSPTRAWEIVLVCRPSS